MCALLCDYLEGS